MTPTIRDLLGKRMLFFDGAMGSLLQQNGLVGGEAPERWNITHPDVILNIHKSYLDAGCDMIKTNTFGANSAKFTEEEFTAKEVITAAVKIARQAVDECGHGYIAMDIGPSGKLMKPLGDLSFDHAYELFSEMAICGRDAGADAVLIETMSDTYEVKAAILAAKENTDLPVFVTMTFDEHGKLLTGGDIPAAVALLEGLGVDGIGFNCGLGPEQMKKLQITLNECCSIPVVINPNAGLPKLVDGKNFYDVGPEEFAVAMKEIAEGGAWVIGGCCGTSPAHLQKMIEVCKDIVPKPLVDKNRTVVSSYGQAVTFGKRPVIIGERINPTGKSRFKEALRNHDMDYILREGLAQQGNGAHILDVNVGLPEIDEVQLMEDAVVSLQSIIDLPLQIDTTNVEAMERAMRIYNGKALINSVNGKQEVMEQIFPLVKKYGGTVIALTIDEEGIPTTAEGRLAVAKKIVETAATYGIPKKDLVVDVLAMTISAEQEAAEVTLKSLELIRDELGMYTSLGVSNISFGLPQRENVNTAFFTMAMQNGLSGAIINPNSKPMMAAYYSYCALIGVDEQCMDYISVYANQSSPTAAPQTTANQMSLTEAIIKGLKESAHSLATEAIQTKAPLDIINQDLIPALDDVGKKFEKGTLFLPQLLMSAEAAKAAFEAIKTHMSSIGASEEKKDKIILATVKGDIHDIGKNIVKVLLENYSYDVIDLGKDVDPQLVVDTAIEQNVKLIGLSALMTTTVVSMEETIKLLHKQVPDCKIMVGGAVLTQEYADMIHADSYSKDAMGSVHYANQLFGHGDN